MGVANGWIFEAGGVHRISAKDPKVVYFSFVRFNFLEAAGWPAVMDGQFKAK